MNPHQKTKERTGIPCAFRDIPEWLSAGTEGKKKSGRYSASNFHIPDFGRKKWVVLAYLDVPDIAMLKAQGMTEDEILEGCVEYLNQPPPRKKYQRRNRKPLYGNLELLSYQYTSKHDEQLLCVSLVTDQRKNKNFWGSGPVIAATGRRHG